MKRFIYEGLVQENPHGDWSDTDCGVYIGYDQLFPTGTKQLYVHHFLDDFLGQVIRITIDVLPDENEEKEYGNSR